MSQQLRRATVEDAADIHSLLVECGSAMARAGFENWNPPIGLEQVKTDIAQREVFCVREGAGPGDQRLLMATVTAALEPTVPYEPNAAWQDPAARALYINRLAVSPALQGSGLGGWLTLQMEERARVLGCTAVRLDALSTNAGLIAFYAQRGYQKRFEREHSGWKFDCLEKVV